MALNNYSKAQRARRARECAEGKIRPPRRQSEFGYHYVEQLRLDREKRDAAKLADESIDTLLMLSEVEDKETRVVRFAKTIAEEIESVTVFVKALGMFIQDGETLEQLLRRVHIEWIRQGKLLLNPVSLKFNQDFIWGGEQKSFDEVFKYLEPRSAYNEPMKCEVAKLLEQTKSVEQSVGPETANNPFPTFSTTQIDL
jgi:hypothetical protein